MRCRTMNTQQVSFRFYGELNDFLPARQRGQEIACPLDGTVAVKHPIESLGVPHPEVELILVGGRSVDFTYWLQEGDRVRVYPRGEGPPGVQRIALRPPLPAPVRFVLDTHLGQLAVYLRMLGFDAVYSNDATDAVLAGISSAERRVLLTRDRGLLKRKIVEYGYCVRQTEPRAQLVCVLRRYDLAAAAQPWRRCVHCNGLLHPVDKAAILDRLEPKTKRYYDEFQQCEACGQVYWQGSHFERMQAFVDGVLAEARISTTSP